jgi:hypothetical protein
MGLGRLVPHAADTPAACDNPQQVTGLPQQFPGFPLENEPAHRVVYMCLNRSTWAASRSSGAQARRIASRALLCGESSGPTAARKASAWCKRNVQKRSVRCTHQLMQVVAARAICAKGQAPRPRILHQKCGTPDVVQNRSARESPSQTSRLRKRAIAKFPATVAGLEEYSRPRSFACQHTRPFRAKLSLAVPRSSPGNGQCDTYLLESKWHASPVEC